ncbi:MAG: glutamine--fructose-6-phosphate aminotransferase, partial [Pseudomonadota bacterium]
MCGIVGVLGEGNVVPKVLKRLKALEYRGYDSAGIAIVEKGEIELRRAAGKLSELEALMADEPMEGATAIGHTRWATHGAPTQENAHPHVADKVAVIHNGIIENHLELRAALEAKGEAFRSETDTEVVLRLVSHRLGSTNISPEQAVKESIAEVRGAFALA